VHEIVSQKLAAMKPWVTILTATTLAAVSCGIRAEAADKFQKLSGAQIRAKFSGMQLTDEVHWRYVYERGGRLRSYSMGTKKIGTWAIEKDELCLDLKEPDDGCYEVSRAGDRIAMKPSGSGLALEGVLQTPADRD
jgi:hypothetical protein